MRRLSVSGLFSITCPNTPEPVPAGSIVGDGNKATTLETGREDAMLEPERYFTGRSNGFSRSSIVGYGHDRNHGRRLPCYRPDGKKQC
ncbi:hypothetical protein BT96DRAFT_342433 [Gymnopus androsaceus JB14]|uniref:Uncharacterized protein n=1 Tax=Gymnopus androsaceus JB14 TaxID=1447944 RepID=A0A6A4GYW7_9AGAR|nr:hypothetical protein BT96DRAFT_342433 [Gymnopus androsaceus JB14]